MADHLVCRHKVPVGHGSRMMRLCGNAADDTAIGPRCPQHAPPARTEHAQRTRAIIAAKKLTLSRQERHELAEMLCGYSGTWATIDEECARRIADALDGFLIVQALLLLRRQR